MSNKPLTGRRIRISVNEPSCGGVIIAGLEVIEAAFGIVVVTTVAERVLLSQRTSGGQDLAVGVVGITCHGIPAGIHQAHDIALQIRDVIVGRAIDLHGIGLAGVVIEEVMGLGGPIGRNLLLQQLPTDVDVTIRGGRFGFQNLFTGLGNGFAAFFRRRFFIWCGDSSQFLSQHPLYFVPLPNLLGVIHRFEGNLGQ